VIYCPADNITDIPAARKLPDREQKQADKHDSGAVQLADLQSPRLPRRTQHGAQVRDGGEKPNKIDWYYEFLLLSVNFAKMSYFSSCILFESPGYVSVALSGQYAP